MVRFSFVSATYCRKGEMVEAEAQDVYPANLAVERETRSRKAATQVLEPRDHDSSTPGRPREAGELIEVLQDIQELKGYLPEELLREVAADLQVPLIEVFRIANFYKAFSLQPKGRHLITICNGTACHVRRSESLVEELRSLLGIGPGETTSDGRFSLETVNCLGACALGPIVVIDGEYHDHVTPVRLRKLLRSFDENKNGE